MDLYLAQPDKLNYCLSKFVLEARKENGDIILQVRSTQFAADYCGTFVR